MLNNRNRLSIVLAVITLLMVAMVGCTENSTYVVDTSPEITRPVSLKKDLQPIYNSNCNSIGCHNTGGVYPDLTPANSYKIASTDLVDLKQPAESEILMWLTGEIQPAMPLGGKSNPSQINQLMLAWIQQGAQNN